MHKSTFSVCNPFAITSSQKKEQSSKSALIKAISVSGVLLLAPFAQAFDLNEMLSMNSEPYSGTQSVAIGDNDKPVFTAQTYHEGHKIRMDLGEGEENMSVVVDMTEGDSTMLMHELSMYKTIRGKSLKKFQTNWGMEYTNQQELGRETVNGVSTTKYSADHVDPDGRNGSGTYWVTDGGILVRSEMEVKRRRKTERTTTNLTNIQMGDQPDELFEIPATYKPISLGSLFSGGNGQNNSEPAPVSDQERAQNETYDDQSEPAPEPETRGKKARKVLGRLLRGGE